MEIEMSNRAREDDEDRGRKGQANVAVSSSSPPEAANAAAAAVGMQRRKKRNRKVEGWRKGRKEDVCQDYLTDKGCPKEDQCPHAHQQDRKVSQMWSHS